MPKDNRGWRWCWHDWPQWSDRKTGVLNFADGSTINIEMQVRNCRKCNKQQTRRIEFDG